MGATADYVPCLGKCGKRVLHQSGLCRDCRKIQCKHPGCKAVFSPQSVQAKFCGEHARKAWGRSHTRGIWSNS